MKKFNVKVLSMAVTAAVASGAAGAAEQNFAAAVGGKDDQGQAAFFTVFGEGTTYDKGTGKLTFKKDSDALLLKTLELEQAINGFASGSNFITTDANGNKTVREATNEDIEADSLKGVGLAGGLTAVNARVDDVNARVDDLLDDTAAALDEQEKAIEKLNNATKTNIDQITKITEGVNTLNTSVAEMGKGISTKFDEVDSEISKASSELSESIEKVSEDVTAVNTRVDSLAQDTADAKAAAKAAEDKVTELSANVDSKVKEAKDAADKAVDAASKIDAVADKADKASKGVVGLTKALEAAAEQAALASAENAQALNGFVEGDEIVVTDKNGIKSIKTATQEDVENADFEGMGLKEVVTAHDETLDDLTKAVTENNEALVKNAEVVNAISADVNANKAALEEQKEANEGFNNAIASLDKDIGDLASAGKAAMEALEVNRQDIDANKAAIAENTAKLEEQKEANEGFNNAIASLDKDIGDLASAGKAAMEALEVNRQDIDANKKYIGDLALAGKAAADALEANRQDIDANKAAIAENTAKLEEQKEANEGFNNAIASLDKDIGDLASAGKAAMEALEVNRQDIDANKAAIAENTAKLEEQKEANEGFNNAIASLDKDIGDLASAGKAAMEALEVNRQDIDANKKYIGDLALAGKAAADALEANRQDIDANKAAIAENTAKLEEQKEANEGFNNAIASLDKDIGDLASAGKAAMEALEINRQDIDANKAAIETKADKADFEELAKYTADMGKKVNDIGDEVTALSDATNAAITRHDKDIVDLAQAGLKATEALEANRKDIDANKKYIGDLALAGKAAADALEANRQDIDANKAAIAENTAKLEEQKEANEGFNNAIASLDKDIGDLALAGKAAADALEANRQDIDANKAAVETKADKTAVESVRTIAVEAQKSAQAAKGAVEVAQKSAETADSHAKAAQTAAAKAQESADTNAVQIAANTKQIDTNKTDIAALQTANGQHAAGIAKNSARIDSLDKNVANLRKETRQGLAAQAALSGLFQPYSVGKFNLTAALGGFKSDTAVAVGAGYRFNENFAAKAGLAVGTSSGGSASYNVGLNYEW